MSLEFLRLDQGASSLVQHLLSIPPTAWKAKLASTKQRYLEGLSTAIAFGLVEDRSFLQQAIFTTFQSELAQSYIVTASSDRTVTINNQLLDALCLQCSMRTPVIERHEIRFASYQNNSFDTAWQRSRLFPYTVAHSTNINNDVTLFTAIIKYPT